MAALLRSRLASIVVAFMLAAVFDFPHIMPNPGGGRAAIYIAFYYYTRPNDVSFLDKNKIKLRERIAVANHSPRLFK